MSGFSVYTVPGSPFGRAVCATLEEKRAAYRIAAIAPGTLKQEAHLRRQPFGRIPVLDHDGFLLYETQAILRYLDRVLPTPALTPSDPKAAARMDQVMNVTDWHLFQGVSSVIGFQRIVGPKLLGLKPDEAAISAAMPKAHVVVDELSRLLGSNAHFAGAALSLADLHVYPQLAFLAETPEWTTLAANAANLRTWLARIEDRPSARATTWAQIAEKATPA